MSAAERDQISDMEGQKLLRIGACWPAIDQCDPEVISVTYEFGVPLGELGTIAYWEVACEMLQGVTTGECDITSNAVSITRQGVTVNTQASDGRTGLTIPDAWLDVVNPNKLRARPRVYSPDLPRRSS